MLLLAIDTSTTAVTVALHDGSRVVAERSTLDARRHTEHVAPGVEGVLQDAGVAPGDVTDVAVGVGPGPFTGLRVGMVTATVFAHARGIPVHGVCSLDALAHEAAAAGAVTGEFVVATDARRKEVYWARYAAVPGADGAPPRATRLTHPAVDLPATVGEALGGAGVVGRGPLLYPDHLAPAAGPLDVSAGALAAVALSELAAGRDLPVVPMYLRRPDAAPSQPRKPALPAPRPGRAGA
ncbi:MAG TPA: tRNA (adenosine(37)-N6)-threonylcarbamoyltransferase complex dimerization subunit type 1 TsaB [Pedococcus sp.]